LQKATGNIREEAILINLQDLFGKARRVLMLPLTRRSVIRWTGSH